MQNFGKIKTAFNNLLANSIGKKDAADRLLFKKYLKAIKESDILKTQFFVYNNIENRVDTDLISATHFVNENVNLLSKFNSEDIIKENKKLLSITDKLEFTNDYDLATLHESINVLVTTKKNPTNIDVLSDKVKVIAEYIKNNKPKEINESVDLPRGMFASLVVDKFNERYSCLNENDKAIIRMMHNSDLSVKTGVYINTINECIDLINTKLSESNLETKEKLLMVKDKLLNDKQKTNSINYVSEIAKLVELKTSLIND